MSNLRVGQICIITTNDSWIGYNGDICKILELSYDGTVMIDIIKSRRGRSGAKGWDNTTYIIPISVKYYYEKV